MKRLLCLAVLVAGSGCFNFDQRLASCRNDAGAWICGGDAGGPGGDGGQVLVLPGREGLVCQQGWCWEHPRPAGHDLETLWGPSESDLWVGGKGGLLAHWDGARWSNVELPRDLTVTSICGHDGDVYAGMGSFGMGPSTERLLRSRAGAWSPVDANLGDVTDLSCGSRLLVSHFGGLAAASWADPRPRDLLRSPSQMEVFNAVLETGAGDCLVSSHENGGETFARIQHCDGGLEWGNAAGVTARVEGLWRNEAGAAFAGVSGIYQVLEQDAGNWWPVQQGNETEYVVDGIPFNGGSLAVGPWGTVVEFTPSGPVTTKLETKRNDGLYAVFRPDGGAPIAVGEWGCITQLTDLAGRGWTLQNDCSAEFLDVSFSRRLLALTDDAVWERKASGWSKLLPLGTPRQGLREQQDGGLLFLTDSALMIGELQVPLNVTDAQAFELVSDRLAVVVTGGGAVIEIALPEGTRRTVVPSGAVGQPVVDELGHAWVRGPDGDVFVSRPGGEWATERVSDSGALTGLAVGSGKVWGLRDATVYWRSTGSPGWNPIDAQATYTRLAPLSATEVLLIDEETRATRLNLDGNLLPASLPPRLLTGHLTAAGGEVWSLTTFGELVRFKP